MLVYKSIDEMCLVFCHTKSIMILAEAGRERRRKKNYNPLSVYRAYKTCRGRLWKVYWRDRADLSASAYKSPCITIWGWRGDRLFVWKCDMLVGFSIDIWFRSHSDGGAAGQRNGAALQVCRRQDQSGRRTASQYDASLWHPLCQARG